MLRSIFGTDLDRLTQQLGGNPFALVTKESERNLQFAYKFRSLTRLVAELIARRRSEPAEHFDFLAMLLAARDKDSGAPMPERELIDEVMTLIVAGHETTASGLNWTWYLLSQHPQVVARLHAELDAAPEYAAPSLAQMEALSYTQQVMNESLRLYPPGWLLSRRTIEADVLGGYHGARQEPTCCCRCTCCTGIRSSGASRSASIRSASRPSTRPSGRASPTCPSRPARATASARRSRCTRCSCTCTRWPAATA